MVDRDRPAELAVPDAGPDASANSSAARVDVGRQPARRGLLVRHLPGQVGAQFGHAGTRLGRRSQHRHPAQPLGGEQPTEIVQAAVAIGLRQPIRLVQTTIMTSAYPARGLR